MTTARVIILNISLSGLWWWLRQLRICLQCRRPGFNPWVKNISWRRTWQPTPVFLPGESPRMEEPAGCSPRGREELDTTERQSSTQRPCSFLQNPRLLLPPEHPGPWRLRCPAQPRARTLRLLFSLPGMHFLQTLYDSLHHMFPWFCLHTVFAEQASDYTFDNCKPSLDQLCLSCLLALFFPIGFSSSDT